MKKIFLILVLIIALVDLAAQESSNTSKGTVSFRFNQSNIEGKIIAAIIRKEDNIKISFHSRMELDNQADNIDMEFAVTDLKEGTKVLEDYSSIDYQSAKKDGNGQQSSTRFASRGKNAQFSTQFSRFEYPKSPTKIFLDEVSLQDGKLKIKGRFEGVYTSPEEQSLNVAKCEIKDGKFEIIL